MEILKDSKNGNYIKDTNPYEKFENIENNILSFYMKYNQLKNLYRQGWLKVRIGLEHKDKCESVADHCFSVALLAITIIEKYKLDYDVLKCMKMAIIHELGEIYAGDYTPFDNITKQDKHLKEKEAVKKVLEELDFNNDFLDLWEEYEKRETKEAIFIKNVDELEFLLQASSYGLDASCFQRCLSHIEDEHCREIATEAVKETKGKNKPAKIG